MVTSRSEPHALPGWVAVGFPSEYGEMVPSDIMLGWVEDGVVSVDDYWATDQQEGCPGMHA